MAFEGYQDMRVGDVIEASAWRRSSASWIEIVNCHASAER